MIINDGNEREDELLANIPNQLYFTIGEVSNITHLESHVLRYWEKEFSSWLSPTKNIGGRRSYTRENVLMILVIRELLYKQGFTIEGARIRLSERGSKTTPDKPRSVALLNHAIGSLQSIMDSLGEDE